MSIYLRKGIFVKVNQLSDERAPQPLPLSSGFSENRAYEVLGIYCASETSEAYFILSNDLNQVWFISNRHFEIDPVKTERLHSLFEDLNEYELAPPKFYNLKK